jgi:hypothetical protein
MESTWPCVVEMPDLSDLAAGLLSAWFLHATFIESFPPGRAAFLSSSFVRATEHTLRRPKRKQSQSPSRPHRSRTRGRVVSS